jgi:hypothetical protein
MSKTYRVLNTFWNRSVAEMLSKYCAPIGETFVATEENHEFINGMFRWRFEEVKPEVHPVTAVPEVSITSKRLTIDKIAVDQTFIVHGKPDEVYVKISNSHVFNHKRLQMHTTDAQRFTQHLNLVVVELVVYDGE